MKPHSFTVMAWILFAVSGLLIVWQFVAYWTGHIPDHIWPFVVLLSGTQEAVLVAYAWTLRLGVLSVMAFLGSGIFLAGSGIVKRFR